MCDFPKKINNCSFLYFSATADDWQENLPSSNWLLLLIGDSRDESLIDDIANTSLEKKVAYVCTLGEEAEWMHDWFDEIIVSRSLAGSAEEPVTTFHEDFEAGVWFAFYAAFGEKEIEMVVCLDLTDDNRVFMKKLLKRI